MQQQGLEVPFPMPVGAFEGQVTPSPSLQDLLPVAPATILTPSLPNMQRAESPDDDVLMKGVEFAGEKMDVDTSAAQGEPPQRLEEEFADAASE